MKKTDLHISCALNPRAVTAFVASMVAVAAINAKQPKLVVGIVIDGLRGETLELLRGHLEHDGFNRFLREGAVFDNVDYGTNLDATAATALVMTGAAPNVNGISGERIYEPAGQRTVHIFNDDNVMGNYTDESLSPRALKVTTLSDEARIAGAGVTYVHAIAPNSSLAITLGGHAANSSVWFNDNSGNWATTTFYGDMPAPAINANRIRSLATRLDTMQWTPSETTARAVTLPDHLVRYPFRYTFARADRNRYARFANSPLINNEITRLATEYITSLELGHHDGTDVLNLAYTLLPCEWSKTPENRYEQYDSYVKLDHYLAELFRTIDRNVGRENAIIYITSTPPRNQRRRDDDRWNIPGGEFSSRKAISLLNLYLIAMHGNGEWVTAFNDGHFYLNAELANSLDKNITTIRRQATEFLVRMAGVGHAYTIDDVVTADVIVPNAVGMARNTVISHSGDVIIELLPGWALVDDYNIKGSHPTTVKALAPTTAPFMVVAPEITPRRIDKPVDARALAPALAGMLHIRSPNGSETAPVNLIGN